MTAPSLSDPSALLTTIHPATLGSSIPQIVPPSPHSAELGRFGAVPVGLYTGTIQYSIPIYELNNEYLSLPISLDYSSNGFIVDKLSSWVGYDWSLNAGGTITRYRKGKTDVPGIRYYQDWYSLTTPGAKINFLENVLFSNRDLQPDMFVVNLPGYSFKFVFDNDGVPVTIPYTPVIIETNSSGAYSYFHITTPDGVLYKFEVADATFPPGESSFCTAWHLSEIIHPTGKKITFTYSTSTIEQKVGIDRKVLLKVASGSDPGGACNCSEFKAQITTISNTISYLSQIDFEGLGKVIFEKGSGRTDAPFEYKLDKITVKNNSGATIKSFQLNYQFPLRTGTYSCQICTTQDVNYRMFLTSLNEQDKTGNNVKTYTFEYNDLNNLPARFSYAQDHWGYFNGKYNNDIISINDVPSNYQGIFSGHVGFSVNRISDYLYARKGMLNKVIYPTGGYSTFEYDANRNSSGIQVGGCRVLRTKSYPSPSAAPIIKKYNYLQVSTFGSLYPTYFQNQSSYYEYTWNSSYYAGQCDFGILSSNSLNYVYVDGQHMVCYPLVEVLSGENGENGKERYSYSIVFDTPGTPVNGGQIQPLPISNTGWLSGNLYESLISDNLTSKKKEETNYNFNEPRNKTEISCLAINKRLNPYYLPTNDYMRLSYYDAVPYIIHSYWFYVTSSVVTQYESNGNIITTKNNSYENASHCQITEQTLTNSDGVEQKTRWRYPHDYNNVSNFSILKDKNIIALPVDVRQYYGDQLSTGIQTSYNNDGQPVDIYSAEPVGSDIDFSFSSPYTFTHKLKFEYNTNDRIRQVTDDTNYNTVYLWDATGNYVMAKIDDASYSTVSSLDGKSYNYSSKLLYNSLKSLVPGALITTYSYVPLVGMKESTDPTGITTFYNYDSFGRLSTVKNNDYKILNQYEYHYVH